MKIALFVTCLGDVLYPNVGKATVEVLERLGHEVVFPQAQTCCGQMHTNTGYQRDAVGLVRHHVEVFEQALAQGCEAIVAPSGSCAGSVRHQHASVARRAGDEDLAVRAEAVAAKTFELSQLLVDVLGVTDVGAAYPHRVTYHPTCHSLRLLGVGEAPLMLLRAVRGIDLVELDDAEVCCGFGGTFSIKNAETSTAMLADKMSSVLATKAEVCCGFGGTFSIKNAETSTAMLADKMSAVLATKAEVVTAGDASCLMHIGGGLSRLRTGVRPVHLAEILASTA